MDGRKSLAGPTSARCNMQTFLSPNKYDYNHKDTDDLFYFHDCHQHLVFRGNLALGEVQESGQGLCRIGVAKDSYMAVFMKVSAPIFFFSVNTFFF